MHSPQLRKKRSRSSNDGAASVREWLSRHASPLVIKRSADEDIRPTIKAILATMHKNQGKSQAERARSLLRRYDSIVNTSQV